MSEILKSDDVVQMNVASVTAPEKYETNGVGEHLLTVSQVAKLGTAMALDRANIDRSHRPLIIGEVEQLMAEAAANAVRIERSSHISPDFPGDSLDEIFKLDPKEES